MWGIDPDELTEILNSLEERGTIVRDLLTIGAVEPQIADAENLEMLLRMLRKEQRTSVRESTGTVSADWLAWLFACRQGLVRGCGMETGAAVTDIERLKQVMEPLFGYSAACELWEREIFPARIGAYQRTWLDSLLRETDLIWAGTGRETITFMFGDEADLFLAPIGGSDEDSTKESLREVIAEAGWSGLGFWDLLETGPGNGGTNESSSSRSEVLAKSVWQLAWDGRITSDTFETIRHGIAHRFTPASFSSGPGPRVSTSRRRSTVPRMAGWQASRPSQGRWTAVHRSSDDQDDMISREERTRDRVRQLLERYGVLFREIVAQEGTQVQWTTVFRMLRRMELAGEVVSGYFIRGTSGVQFADPSMLELLRSLRRGKAEPVFWMNACDPASPCGLGIASELDLPARLPSNHLVFCGSRLVVVSRKNGRHLDIRVDPGDTQIGEFLNYFRVLAGREGAPRRRIQVETVNGLPVRESQYADALISAGFRRDYKTFVLPTPYH